jgi:putative transposase
MLPPVVSEAISHLSLSDTLSPQQENSAFPLSELKKWQRDTYEARLALYREFQRLESDLGTVKAADELAGIAKTGRLPSHLQQLVPVANARSGSKRGKSSLSKSTILRWKSEVKQDGLTALAPKTVCNQSRPAWADAFCKRFHRPQKPSIPEAMQAMIYDLPPGVAMPSYSQVTRWHRGRSKLDQERGRMSKNSMRSMKNYTVRTTEGMFPMDTCQCDGHSFKAKVQNPEHQRPFHPEVCSVIDIVTRVCVGWSAGLAESSITVADAIRHAATVNKTKLYGGIPAILYTDQGAGNKSAMVSGEVTGMLARLGATFKTGIPGNAQGRGLVERANVRLWISAAKQLDTYTGRDMDPQEKRKIYLELDRDVRKNNKATMAYIPTWKQFLEGCQRAVDAYNNTPHKGLKRITDPQTGRKRHMTPMECWASYLQEGWQPTLLTAEDLDDMKMPQVIRKAVRGGVSVFGNRYTAPEIEHYGGQELIVEYDIHDAEHVRVRDAEERLICVASFSRSRRKFFSTPVIEQARDKREKRRLERVERKREEIEAERRGTIDLDPMQNRLSRDEEELAMTLLADKPDKQNDIDEAYEAITAGEQTGQGAIIDAMPMIETEAINEMADDWQNLDGWQRYEYLQRLESLSEEQTAWKAYYKTTKEFKALADIYEEQQKQGGVTY